MTYNEEKTQSYDGPCKEVSPDRSQIPKKRPYAQIIIEDLDNIKDTSRYIRDKSQELSGEAPCPEVGTNVKEMSPNNFCESIIYELSYIKSVLRDARENIDRVL